MATGNDIKANQATYDGFMGLVKISIPVLAVITAVVIKLIA
ncbi:MAG: hypothetical protein RLZZ136_945 [Pseudomonadota bacterium]|jgi:hypothetical protein